jgi:hypothetical protein
VAGAEGVVAVDVGHVGQRLREIGGALLLACIEPQVFQHQDVAVLQRGGFGAGIGTDRVGGERDRLCPAVLGQLSAVGFMLYLASPASPLGRPRWLIRIKRPPRSMTERIEGSAIRMRRSSVTFC